MAYSPPKVVSNSQHHVNLVPCMRLYCGQELLLVAAGNNVASAVLDIASAVSYTAHPHNDLT